MKRLVLGFDPGETVGLALVDLEKNAILIKSIRNAGIDKVIEEARSFGKPILVASDVTPAPQAVKKLAAAFGAEVFCPEVSLSVEEKKNLAEVYGYGDAHQRDALAAALRAHTEVSSLIERARRKGTNYEEVVEDIIKGRSPHIAPVIRQRRPVEKKFSLPVEVKLRLLRQQLENKNVLLSMQRRELEGLKENLKENEPRQTKAVPESKRYRALMVKVKNLNSRLEHITRNLRKLSGEIMILQPSLEGEVVFVPAFDEVAAKQVKAKIVVTSRKTCDSKTAEVWTLGQLNGIEIEGMAFVPLERLPNPGKEWLVKMVDAYKKERTF